jgi:hypothetical protein
LIRRIRRIKVPAAIVSAQEGFIENVSTLRAAV